MIAVMTLVLTLLLAVAGGVFVLVRWSLDQHATRKVQIEAARAQRQHDDAVRSIQLAKAWETVGDRTQPELPTAPPAGVVLEADDLAAAIRTMNRYNARAVRRTAGGYWVGEGGPSL